MSCIVVCMPFLSFVLVHLSPSTGSKYIYTGLVVFLSFQAMPYQLAVLLYQDGNILVSLRILLVHIGEAKLGTLPAALANGKLRFVTADDLIVMPLA